MRTMSRSALDFAREALRAARKALPDYASKFSKHDFTQPQLLAILMVRQFLRTDYRGVEQFLLDWSDLRAVLGLKKVPHYSTLCLAQERLLKKGLLIAA